MKDKYSLLLETSALYNSQYITARVITLENNKPRNISGSFLFETPKTQFYENLTLKAHYSQAHHDLGLVIHGIEYTDVLSIDQFKADYMVKTLKRIGAKIEKLDNGRVYSGRKTYAQTVLDLASCINAEFIVIKQSGNSSSYDDNEYRLYKPSGSQYAIQSIIDSIINAKAA